MKTTVDLPYNYKEDVSGAMPYKNATDKDLNRMYYCDGCGVWVEGHPDCQRSFFDRQDVYKCKVCGYILSG